MTALSQKQTQRRANVGTAGGAMAAFDFIAAITNVRFPARCR